MESTPTSQHPAEMNHRGSEKNGTTPIFGRIPEIRGEEKEMDDQESIFGGRSPFHAPKSNKKYDIGDSTRCFPTNISVNRSPFLESLFFSCSQAYMVACRALSMAFKEAFCIVRDFQGNMSKSITRLVIQAESTRGREGGECSFFLLLPPRASAEGERRRRAR